MIAFTTVTGSRYKSYCEHLTKSLQDLDIKHTVIEGDGGKSLKVNWWRYIPECLGDEVIVFLDADTIVSKNFKIPNFGDSDILGVDVLGLTGNKTHWAVTRTQWGAKKTPEYFQTPALNSGVVFYRNKEVAARVGKRWDSLFPHKISGATDEPSFRSAIMGERIGMLSQTYNDVRNSNALIYHNTRKNYK